MTAKQTFEFPYRGSRVKGYITGTHKSKLLIEGAYDSKGLFFVKEGDKIQLFSTRKLAADACSCEAADEYEHNKPITGGPPEYHAGVNQSTKAPKEYPGATEHDLHNSIAGIDEGEIQQYNPQSQIIHDNHTCPHCGHTF